jgi:hypothetical protein
VAQCYYTQERIPQTELVGNSRWHIYRPGESTQILKIAFLPPNDSFVLANLSNVNITTTRHLYHKNIIFLAQSV